MNRPRPPLFRPDIARDVDDELAAHLALCEQELIARGVSPDQARSTARRRFGDPAAIARECRAIDEGIYRQERRAGMWRDLRQDAGYALRLLRRAPGFTAVAVVTLAIGIGATTTIFSLANWALLRPVAGVTDSDDVRVIWSGRRSGPSSFSPSRISYPNFNDMAPRLQTVALGAYQQGGGSVARFGQPARPIHGLTFTTASYFDVLGVRMRAGRAYTNKEDDPAGGAHVAVLSAPGARSLFASEESAIGQEILINGRVFTVIGVAGEGFSGTHRLNQTQIWLPGSTYPFVNHFAGMRYDNRSTGGFYEFVARPREGATWAQVEAELTSLKSWLMEQHPKENARLERLGFNVMEPIGTDPMGGGPLRDMLALMLSLSGVVLLIACSNVASLLLMRGIGRSGEVAVRKALGAGRVRLVRQHLTEGAVLWLAGGSVGLLSVWMVLQAIDGATLLGLRAPVGAVPLDWRVVGFALALSLVVGLVFSVVPALRSSSVQAAGTLREGGASATPRKMRIGTTLSAVQLALSLMLVVSALLLAATVRQLSRVELGFDPSGVYTFAVRPGSVGYSPDRGVTYRDEFARRLRMTPGVERVSILLRGGPFLANASTRVRQPGAKEVVEPQGVDVISTGYFETLRIPLLRGRTLSDDDLGTHGAARPVVVVSEALARELFGSIDVVGRRIEFHTQGRVGKPFEVIGVVGDVRNVSLTEAPEPTVYEPAGIDGPVRPEATFLIRTRQGTPIEAAVREIAASLDPALPVVLPRWMHEVIAGYRAPWDVLARLMTTLAVMAGILAAVGLYGVIAFGVAARRKEFGIRLALGAAPSRLVGIVLLRSAMITATGLVLGCAGAAALLRVIRARLFGVEPYDPLVWSASIAVLAAIALFAAWLPAWRAARVDPVAALRV